MLKSKYKDLFALIIAFVLAVLLFSEIPEALKSRRK